MDTLFHEITTALHEIQHGWTAPPKAHALAACVLALRPQISVEIGTWAGKGLVSLGMAHRAVKTGMVYGVDPYSAMASAEGQENDHKDWWGKLDHEWALQTCQQNIIRYGLQEYVTLIRSKSEDWTPPDGIGLLRVDGNHGPAVLKDIAIYAPRCAVGAFLFLDDLGWPGGAPQEAAAKLRESGWKELYTLDDGLVFQKVNSWNPSPALPRYPNPLSRPIPTEPYIPGPCQP